MYHSAPRGGVELYSSGRTPLAKKQWMGGYKLPLLCAIGRFNLPRPAGGVSRRTRIRQQLRQYRHLLPGNVHDRDNAGGTEGGREGLVAWLKNKYGISKVQAHRDVCATSCPGMNFTFTEIVGSSGSVSVTTTPSERDDGKTELKADDWWGSKTTTRLQQIFGTVVGGVVSNQFSCYEAEKPGLDGGWKWLPNPSGYSPLIKAIQRKVGAK